jgi:hypothetical protein
MLLSTWLSFYDPGEAQTTFTKKDFAGLSPMRFLPAREELLAVCGSILGD